jgi:hypothetical protein
VAEKIGADLGGLGYLTLGGFLFCSPHGQPFMAKVDQ